MNRIIEFYSRNKKAIWLFIVILIIILLILNTLNKIAKENNESKRDDLNNNLNNNINNNTSYSIIAQTTIEAEKGEMISEIIEQFVTYCNNNQIEQAYNMISEECKSKFFTTLEEFKNKYYNNIFDSKKDYEIQLWDNDENYYIYRIDFIEDMLSTGNYSSKKIQDYYTVDIANNKLNINGYIANIPINAVNEKNNIEITVLSKDIYVDYEILNISIKNNTTNSILLDSGENTDTMYIQNEGGLKFTSYSHELVYEHLRVKAQKSLSIKFNKKYGIKNYSEKLVLSDIILNNEEYEEYKGRNSSYSNRMSIEITLY